MENTIYICHFCGSVLDTTNAEEKSNARGVGLYLHCDKCQNDNVLAEYEDNNHIPRID